ncbi:MAG: DUF3418 domain-containing protein, partial [Promicromonosporaceae bacterium]|nr:DUF3418 domain-containing protein [Promicromonosporaceae bacterium]
PCSRKRPGWIMGGDLVGPSRLWARTVARIDPEWAEPLAGGIAKRTYSDPRWSKRNGAAMVTEKVLLYGVPIVADRQILYARVNAPAARELFIRHALVQGEWSTHHRFWRDNQATLAEAEQVEARARRRGLLASDDDLFDFYDERLPEQIVSARHFDRWWGKARRGQPDLLTLTLDDLLPPEHHLDSGAFPEFWPQGDLQLPLTYEFDPGSARDGVTVHIPLAVLPRVYPQGFDWLVPGLLEDLCIGTIRSLPKALRVQLVPAPDVGSLVAAWLRTNTPAWADMARAGDMAEPFSAAFARAVRDLRGVVIPETTFDDEQAARLPSHLRLTFQVGDQASTSLLALQRSLAGPAAAAVASAVRGAVGVALEEARQGATQGADQPGGKGQGEKNHDSVPGRGAARERAQAGGGPGANTPETVGLERDNVTEFPVEIPESVETAIAGGAIVRGYPALVAALDSAVCLRVLATPEERDEAHAGGVRALLLAANRLADARVTSRWGAGQALALAASPYPNTAALVTDLHRAAIASLVPAAGAIRTAAAYDEVRAEVRQRLEDEVYRIAGDVGAALTAARALQAEVKATQSLALLGVLQDIRGHLATLIYPGFVADTSPRRLPMLVRYLRADSHRLEKAAGNPARDAELTWRLTQVQQAYDGALARAGAHPSPELLDVRWQIEELRVSFFAQQLGTDGTVSEQRIRRALAP